MIRMPADSFKGPLPRRSGPLAMTFDDTTMRWPARYVKTLKPRSLAWRNPMSC
jgi:hypothetical protein